MLSPQKLRLIDLVRGIARRPSPGEPAEGIAELSRRAGRQLRVAVLRADGIGDWLLTLPLVKGLRDSPHVSQVTLVSVPAHRGLLARDGVDFEAVDLWAAHHTPWPHGAIGKVLAISRVGQHRARATGRRLRGRFDVVVLPRWDTDRGQNLRFLAVGADAEIAGHDPALQPQASAKERTEGAILTIACRDARQHAHESERIAALADALRVALPDGATAGREFLGLPPGRRPQPGLVVMHTSAHDSFRCWPLARWADLIRGVLTREGASVVLVGSANDRPSHESLIAIDPARVRSVAGETGLDALPAMLDAAELFCGNDSGPAHFAAAVGVPTIVISCFPEGDDPGHPNSPDRFAPRSAGGGVVVRPGIQAERFEEMSGETRDALISQVPAEEVLGRLREIIGVGGHD